jgi:hypothetical protein
MARSLADLLDEMNDHLPKIKRHFNRGVRFESRWDGHSCHCVIDCPCSEIDGEDAPETLHATPPDEA